MTDAIHQALDKHFAKHRIIFWYDPDGTNREIAESYEDVAVVEVGNDHFSVKHRLLRARPEERALVYIPAARPSDEENWLLDIELSHFVFSTNQAAWIAEELGLPRDFEYLLERHLAFFNNRRDRFEPFQAIVERRGSTIDETTLLIAMIAVLVSDTKSERQSAKTIQEIAIKLFEDLSAGEQNRGYLEEIDRYGLSEKLYGLLGDEFGCSTEKLTLESLLAHLFRHGLLYELGTDRSHTARQAYTFLDLWRNNIAHSDAFARLAERFGKELNVRESMKNLSTDALLRLDLFKETDRQIVHRLIAGSSEKAIATLDGRQYVAERRGSYWVSRDPGGKIGLYYSCLGEYYEFKIAVNDAEIPSTVREIWARYVDGLYLIDYHYRRFLELAEELGDKSVLQPLLASVEADYVNGFLQSLSEAWSDALGTLDDLRPEIMNKQSEFFGRIVAPYLVEDRVVFVIVSDALRYECAAELADLLASENRLQVNVEAFRAAVPTYTQLGMAALLPHGTVAIDPTSLHITSDGKTVLGLEGRGALLREYLERKYPGKQASVQNAREFLAMSASGQEAEIRDRDVVYLYSNHIDATGDNTKTEQALPAAVRAEIDFIRSLVKRIVNLNRTHIVITADHGYLYQHGSVEDSDMMQVPGNEEILHKDRRFLLGTGHSNDERFLSVPAVDAELDNDFDLYLAKGLTRVRKQGGGTRFVHGGASIHELCVPVIRIRKTREDDVQSVHFVLLSRSSEITTNQISLEFFQTQPVGPKVRPRRLVLRFESEAGNEVISSRRELLLNSEDANDQNRKVTLDFVFTPASAKFSGKLVYLTCYEDRYGQLVQVEERTGFRFRTVLTPDF